MTGVQVDAWATWRPYDLNSNGLADRRRSTRSTGSAQFTYDSQGNIDRGDLPGRQHRSVHVQQRLRAAHLHRRQRQHNFTTRTIGDGNLTVVKDPLTNLTTMTLYGQRPGAIRQPTPTTTPRRYQYDSQDRPTTVINRRQHDRPVYATTPRAT